jgi:hypothetical protein
MIANMNTEHTVYGYVVDVDDSAIAAVNAAVEKMRAARTVLEAAVGEFVVALINLRRGLKTHGERMTLDAPPKKTMVPGEVSVQLRIGERFPEAIRSGCSELVALGRVYAGAVSSVGKGLRRAA